MLQKISQRIKWHSLQIKDFFAQRQCHFPAILSQSDSIRLAAEKKMSISRFGDGELSLMCGKDLNFQTYDKLLAEKMERVISNDNPSVLVFLQQFLIPAMCYRQVFLENASLFFQERMVSTS